jgi:hypothetical protein
MAAARAVGRPPSYFSGVDSMLMRYRREGLAGLERRDRHTAAASDLSQRIEALVWWVLAARFIFLSSRTRRGALNAAVLRTIDLPKLPVGWRKGVREQFLKYLSLEQAPECPAQIREAILARQAAGKSLVPGRIERQIVSSPSIGQRHFFELGAAELAEFPFQQLAKHLANSEPAGIFKVTVEVIPPASNDKPDGCRH